jgi:hypothetical protein
MCVDAAHAPSDILTAQDRVRVIQEHLSPSVGSNHRRPDNDEQPLSPGG